MPVKSKSTVKRHLKELRTLIDTTEDPVEWRVAYAMEMAVRWATEDVAGWCGLVDEARTEASLLKLEARDGE